MGDFYAKPGVTYYFFKLDAPATITGRVGPGTRTNTVRYLYLGTSEEPVLKGLNAADHIGEHMRLLYNADEFSYANEPAFPYDTPAAMNVLDYEIF